MQTLRALWKDRPTRAGFVIALVLLSVLIGVVLWSEPSKQARVLHYNIYFGIDLYGNGRALWWNPLLGGVLFLLNFVIASIVFERQKLAARLTAWSAALTIAIVLAATILTLMFRPL
ncbi:MAG: hypothetical protein V1895_03050 [Parcubacteria group bacterium]